MKGQTKMIDGNGANFEQWNDGWSVGFKVTHQDGRIEYVYLCPSSETDGDPSNVFVYVGEKGNPTLDTALYSASLTSHVRELAE